jgi:hypothetical protein
MPSSFLKSSLLRRSAPPDCAPVTLDAAPIVDIPIPMLNPATLIDDIKTSYSAGPIAQREHKPLFFGEGKEGNASCNWRHCVMCGTPERLAVGSIRLLDKVAA